MVFADHRAPIDKEHPADDPEYIEDADPLQPWCGRWVGSLSRNQDRSTKWTIDLFSDFRSRYHCEVNDVIEKVKISYELTFYGIWKIVDGKLIFDLDRQKTRFDLNNINVPANYPLSRESMVEGLKKTYKDWNRLSHSIRNYGQVYLTLPMTGQSIPVTFYRKKALDYTPYLFPELQESEKFTYTETLDNYYVRGVLEQSDSTYCIGLFYVDDELNPILVRNYTSRGELLEEVNRTAFSLEKLKTEEQKNAKLADKYISPLSGQGFYTFYDNSSYQGQWEDHQPHGLGKKTLANGEYFDGEWKEGKFIKGTASIKQYDSNGPYEGEYSNGEPNGEGRLTRSDCVVVGRFTDGRPKGNMTVTFRDGCVFTGKISNGSDVDNGKMVYPDGSSFEGIWSKNDTWVSGKFTRLDQYYLDGFFSIDRQFSKGTYHDLKKQTELSGTWKANQLIDGHATIIPNDGSNIIQYDGEIAEGSIKGEGTLVLNKGYSITAKWNNGQLWGDAVIKFDNGDSFAGRWINGELVKGTPVTYTWADGVECKCVAGNQSKVSKKKYYRDGVELKSKEAKLYQMMYTASEEKFQLSDDCQSLAGQLKITFTIPCNNH